MNGGIFTCNRVLRLLALGTLGPMSFAQADEEALRRELEELMNTKITVASKTAESPNAAPGIITAISRRELEGFAAQNLGQVLNRVVGMSLQSPDIFVKQSVVIRGQETTPYNNHILVLLNGRPMRDPITGGLNGSYWNSFPLAMVEKLEIIRGPGSVLYGSCAYSGVVNIVTRRREESGFNGVATLGAGSEGAFTQSTHATFKQGELQGILGITHFMDKGPEYSFVDYEGNAGSDHFSRHCMGTMARLEYKGFTFNAYHGNYDPKTLEPGSEIWVPNIRVQERTTHGDVGYSGDLNPKVSLSANVTFNRTEWFTGVKEGLPQASKYPLGFTYGEAFLFEQMLRFKPSETANILVGGGVEKSIWGSDKNGLVLPDNQQSFFFYTQADYRIQALKLIGGIQYNKLEKIKGNLSPRLGLVYDFTTEWGAKLQYNTAFRKGYPTEIGFNHWIFRGNPELKPELIGTLEAQVFYQGQKVQGSLTYFNSHMRDIVTRIQVPDNNPAGFQFKYMNGGVWDSRGVELDGRASLSARLFLTGSYSYQTNKNQAGIKDAALHPNSMAKLGLLYSANTWSLGIFDAWFGKPKSTTLINPGSKVVNPVPEAFHLASIKGSWTPFKGDRWGLKVAVEAENLLDKDIRYPDYPNKVVNSLIPLNKGRTYMASVSALF